jgi:8-oxo-dGTP diphosphatase
MQAGGLKGTAVICVLRHDAEFLLLKRAREPNLGLYVPVGGKLNPPESPRAAALREIREETGIVATEVRLLGTLVETSPTSYNWWSAVYLADIPWVDPPPCAEGELAWIGRVALPEVPMPPTDRFIYEYLLRGRPFAFSADYTAALALIRMEEELSGLRLV